MLYLSIDHNEFVLPDSAPIATLIKSLSDLRKISIEKIGKNYVGVLADKAHVSISNRTDYREVITRTEFNKRSREASLALPETAGPDAHGRNITKRER